MPINYIPTQKEAVQAIASHAKTKHGSIKQIESNLYLVKGKRLYRIHQTKSGSSIHYYIKQPRIKYIKTPTNPKTNHAERIQALANAISVSIDKVQEVNAPFFEVTDDPELSVGASYASKKDGLYIVAMPRELSDLIKNSVHVEQDDYIQSELEQFAIFKIE